MKNPISFWTVPQRDKFLSPGETQLIVHRVDYCRNGSGNGRGYFRIYGEAHLDGKLRRLVIHRFRENTPEETSQFEDSHGTYTTVTDLDEPERMWRYENFVSQIDVFVDAYTSDGAHQWPPKNPESLRRVY